MFSIGHHTSGNIGEDPEHNDNDHRLGKSDLKSQLEELVQLIWRRNDYGNQQDA